MISLRPLLLNAHRSGDGSEKRVCGRSMGAIEGLVLAEVLMVVTLGDVMMPLAVYGLQLDPRENLVAMPA